MAIFRYKVEEMTDLAFRIDSMYSDGIYPRCLREMIEDFHKSGI
ncbi:hypothetical protein PSM36_1817 [Proteiniphilum saccharofermentans]|uniref:Uncharacterized protein n=1 Tax=Proteiniphilum saccharofermentans TaxID=1642647 RepID=A0A1R3SWG7_9BACT|nr:hypothetical protein [Proteiniphilum saccharofermentans]SCD20633.1 hypothetical protein PSM36_1817 [Proteiniphilum saccharofermentans]